MFGISNLFWYSSAYHNFQGIIPNTIRVEPLRKATTGSVMPKNRVQYKTSTMVNPNTENGPNNKLNKSKEENSKWI